MLERSFQWALKHGAAVLFGAAVLIMSIGLWDTIATLSTCNETRSLTYAGRLADCLAGKSPAAFGELVRSLVNAVFPCFGALVIHRFDLWMAKGGAVAATSMPPPTGSWLMRHGPRLMVALAVPYIVIALLSFVIWLVEIPTTQVRALVTYAAWSWLSPIWSASGLLFGALALDRFDRWLAGFRPTYSG